nr:hypothetical protein [uncultured Rhodoferax sp.]
MPEQNPYRTVRRGLDDRSEVNDAQGLHIQFQSHDLKNTRDLRTLLLDAAYEIQSKPDFTGAHVYLHNCTLARKRVEAEVEQFKRIAQPRIAKRIFVYDMRSPAVRETVSVLPQSVAAADLPRKPTTASQEAVLAYLLERHLQSLPGVSISTIAAETKASVPTIYKALNAYAYCLEKDPEDKTLRLTKFEPKDWFHWIQRTNRLSSVYFVDRSGAPRSSSRLAKYLARLGRDDLAIGGLMGAMHHLPEIDATAAPQLDILLHGSARSDLSFIEQIDPGLVRTKEPIDPAYVVVHFIDRPQSLFKSQGGQNWGTLPDCIANMHKAGLAHQVDDALRLVRGKKPISESIKN